MLKLVDINKTYENGKDNLSALKNINLVFPYKGLIAIVGPSGCGKSTLLNLLMTIDRPTSGNIYFEEEDINKFSKRKLKKYRGEKIGIVFQSFNLLENETALENILKPYEMNGVYKKDINKYINNLCEKLGLDLKLLNERVENLSGGERQRVSIIRALINDPKIIFADEPTGQLDESNSLNVFSILKQLSEKRLVIVVTHDVENISKFTTDIIKLKDGRVVEYPTFKDTDSSEPKEKNRKIIRPFWSIKQGFRNLKLRKGKSILSFVAISIGLLSSMLVFSFSSNYKNSISASAINQLDYRTLSVSKETSVVVGGSGLTLVKKERVTEEKLALLDREKLFIDVNFEYICNCFSLNVEEKLLEHFTFATYLEFDNKLLIEGKPPNSLNFKEVVVNSKFEKNFIDKFGFSCLDKSISINANDEVNFINDYGEQIIDYFVFEDEIRIVGIVEDFNFLSTPKIYYPYLSLKETLLKIFPQNISLVFNEDISWYDVIKRSSNISDLSSYSNTVFSYDYDVKKLVSSKNEDIVFSSLAYTREEAFIELMDASSIGLNIFLVMALIGLVFIIGIISFSSYTADKKRIAILYSFGGHKGQIAEIYSSENLFISFLSCFFTFIASPFIFKILNITLAKITGLKNLFIISLEFSQIGVFVLFGFLAIIISYLCAYLPVIFGTGINLREELKDD